MSTLLAYLLFALWAANLGTTGAVIWFYYRAARHAPKHRGLLPHHVWMIGVAYLVLATAITFGTESTVWAVVGAAGMGLGWWALTLILRFEGRRVR